MGGRKVKQLKLNSFGVNILELIIAMAIGALSVAAALNIIKSSHDVNKRMDSDYVQLASTISNFSRMSEYISLANEVLFGTGVVDSDDRFLELKILRHNDVGTANTSLCVVRYHFKKHCESGGEAPHACLKMTKEEGGHTSQITFPDVQSVEWCGPTQTCNLASLPGSGVSGNRVVTSIELAGGKKYFFVSALQNIDASDAVGLKDISTVRY